eukprot:TRINITY_DN45681_c0_g1_i1.p1 TRINITY_DN45681_c0_g1~~TRINITY_DN45681_c0_g1_i1.p1  ORF type:complete len:419 (-),score=24.36 TRINITY_DN45681_c0_g1_i1:407-1663(-)
MVYAVFLLKKSKWSLCFLLNETIVFTLLRPIIVLIFLTNDFSYWLDDSRYELREPVNGLTVDHLTSRYLSNVPVQLKIPLIHPSRITYMRHLDGSIIRYGGGNSGTVFAGIFEGNKVAIKLLMSISIDEQKIGSILAEANRLQKHANPHIVKCFGVSIIPPSICIILELCEYGNLMDFIQRTSIFSRIISKRSHSVQFPLSEDLIKRSCQEQAKSRQKQLNPLRALLKLLLDCATALNELHSHDIVHGDVKSTNFLVDKDFRVKICDLELSRQTKRNTHCSQDRPLLERDESFVVHSVRHSAPELFLRKSWDSYSKETDVFALGMSFYEVISNQVPYCSTTNYREIEEKIISNIRPKIDPRWVEHCQDLMELFYKMTAANPIDRPTVDLVIKSLENILDDVPSHTFDAFQYDPVFHSI